MEFWHFSETAYPYLPPESEYESVRVTLPNGVIDPGVAADLWDRYIDEWQVAEAVGINIMLNEHHQTATCLDSAAPLVAAAIARITSTARILILGNPIANRKDPVRVAEEMALLDILSRGRLDVGFVRGVPYEVLAVNSKPVQMSERLWEAHDLILKAWTTHDGPFNWEGRFFHQRHVNIWPRPFQQPHPPVWVTSVTPGSATAVADRGHVVASFLTGYDETKAIFDAYRRRDAEMGRPEPALDRFAYAALVYTGETEEEGRAGAEKLLWYIRANKVPLHVTLPPGYVPPSVRGETLAGRRPTLFRAFADSTLDDFIDQGLVFCGTPDAVKRQIDTFYERVDGFGHLLIMGQAGFLEHDETVAGIKLFANEVAPSFRGESAAASLPT